MKQENFAIEQKTENFDFKAHTPKALLSALYYIFIYIPFILPFNVWGKAATRMSLLWEQKNLTYNEDEKQYPLFYFYFQYFINFIFDASIVLIWPIGLILSFIALFSGDGFGGFLISLFGFYISVLGIRLNKELTFFIVNKLIIWLIDVIANMGQLIKNAWLLNIVVKRKEIKE
ncbi:hypothetical protein L21SP5_03764 [Salinivirga cyanobacteriivorans]|uniref:Uncharacterized protein n=1 Tax=Salinivirga cyanobacteriivorans TaxID=1307839 RepID=A0A0S2I4T2_9BACT|nr:hypothetical protein [Salinivirga cyanobacteriivorans]ALO17359.1 hypothetical protein L21SP5_03764 [Salinivirga cyanobacteriivorans]